MRRLKTNDGVKCVCAVRCINMRCSTYVGPVVFGGVIFLLYMVTGLFRGRTYVLQYTRDGWITFNSRA